MDHPTHCTFPSVFHRQWFPTVFVPNHSGGSVPEFNRIPLWAESSAPEYKIYKKCELKKQGEKEKQYRQSPNPKFSGSLKTRLLILTPLISDINRFIWIIGLVCHWISSILNILQ